MNKKLIPIGETDRIVVIDILRGFSLLGIFLVNMLDFHSPSVYASGDYWGSKIDLFTEAFIDVVAQASFYPLFAFLFGFGAAILVTRMTERKLSFPLLFGRRMLFLLGLGSIHAFLIWHGDILITYALTGIFLLFFYKMSGKALLISAAVLYCVPYGLIGLQFMFEGVSYSVTNWDVINQMRMIYANGTMSEIFLQRYDEWYHVNRLGNAPYLFLSIFPFFLVGMAFSKLKWVEQAQEYKRKWMAILLFALPVGLLLKLWPYITSHTRWAEFAQDYYGGPLLTFTYISGAVLLYNRFPFFQKWMDPCSYIVKMSVTNYLLQSIICTFIFYNYGFGLYGTIGAFEGSVLALVIIGIQIICSRWWLKRYKMGPVEYVWRTATYWSNPKLKRDKQTREVG